MEAPERAQASVAIEVSPHDWETTELLNKKRHLQALYIASIEVDTFGAQATIVDLFSFVADRQFF